ncbi:MAG: hypothetical protein S4CHLAM45_04190 [Chlamydiales bacterium]|nr:hypothetical protein [Chlamydiales bacterium]MCH9619273.1 hypothetical protein [Chlamydiales bacterium]MCH9622535.1 hypothetical protein [Chlamydiales bacterium]
MLIIKHTIATTATPAQIWKIWQDVENWKMWDQKIELSQIDGPFQTGTTGSIKFVGTPLLKTLLTEVKLYKSVIQETYLSFAKIVSSQLINQKNGKIEVTFQVAIRGPLSLFYRCLLGKFIKRKIPMEMEEMLKRVQQIE